VSSAEPTLPTLPKNPSYPQRAHVQERAQWQTLLKGWEDRIAQARPKLESMGQGPERAAYEKMYAQMLGARDQIADAGRRLPMEVGDLYEEDRHRVQEAVAALERLFRRWG
jgi:hypothetical protein